MCDERRNKQSGMYARGNQLISLNDDNDPIIFI